MHGQCASARPSGFANNAQASLGDIVISDGEKASDFVIASSDYDQAGGLVCGFSKKEEHKSIDRDDETGDPAG